MNIMNNTKYEKIFEYFYLLSSVPHGSGNTKQISDICVNFAIENGLRYYRDDLNNVVIYKDASEDCKDKAPVILQGHLDMVCAKDPDCTLDMEKEGLILENDGEWLWARGTSLGGDNAIAVAATMAILSDKNLSHPPIEAVFTVDEETGMDGATALDTSILKAKRLINLDSEEEGIFTAGCAGGARVNCSLDFERLPLPAEGYSRFAVTINGLVGGHSGVEIHKGRGSSNRLMSRMLYDISERMPLYLVSLEGGKLDNVIPGETVAVVAVRSDDALEFVSVVNDYAKIYKNELSSTDPDVTVSVKRSDDCTLCVNQSGTKRLLTVLFTVPYHVQEMSADVEGLVQTSLNMGVLKLCENELNFSFAVRSSVATQKDELIRRVRALVEFAGGSVSVHGDYPGWQYAKESALRDTVLASYKKLSGEEGQVIAIHAGLECGLFIEKIPGLDCISFGPDLRDVHSTRERLNIPSTCRMYDLVCEILSNLE